LSGFWDDDEVDRYAVDLAKVARAMGALFRGRLVDCCAVSVQSPSVMERLRSTVSTLEGVSTSYTALVVPIGLARMQAQRVFADRDKIAWFSDAAEALEWLLAECSR
jgi:hypothetical protein